MKVICNKAKISSAPFVLPINQRDILSEDNMVWTSYSADSVGIRVKPDEKYNVFAVIIHKSNVYYLIENGIEHIQFLPSEWFAMIENEMPKDWKFFKYDLSDTILVATGPKFLVGEYSNIISIMDNSNGMMKNFLEYKKYLSEWGFSPFE